MYVSHYHVFHFCKCEQGFGIWVHALKYWGWSHLQADVGLWLCVETRFCSLFLFQLYSFYFHLLNKQDCSTFWDNKSNGMRQNEKIEDLSPVWREIQSTKAEIKKWEFQIYGNPNLFHFLMCWKWIWWLFSLCHHKAEVSCQLQNRMS